MMKIRVYIKYYFIKIIKLIFQRQVFHYSWDSEVNVQVFNKLIEDFLEKQDQDHDDILIDSLEEKDI